MAGPWQGTTKRRQRQQQQLQQRWQLARQGAPRWCKKIPPHSSTSTSLRAARVAGFDSGNGPHASPSHRSCEWQFSIDRGPQRQPALPRCPKATRPPEPVGQERCATSMSAGPFPKSRVLVVGRRRIAERYRIWENSSVMRMFGRRAGSRMSDTGLAEQASLQALCGACRLTDEPLRTRYLLSQTEHMSTVVLLQTAVSMYLVGCCWYCCNNLFDHHVGVLTPNRAS